ncbi:hypothetical protein EVG20_g4155 [Dentipellis fragilis]|uniref:histidine kinase n=1 Tax=Dentipellis fragilis TaxID=205917 RepID=A0A4Y9YWZ4_9AGAM|nr:hypothetical protein EVG20_g4155 [Dentipellis fragilis]
MLCPPTTISTTTWHAKTKRSPDRRPQQPAPDTLLPAPVVAASTSSRRKGKKSARIDGGPGTSPSTSSLIDESTAGTHTSDTRFPRSDREGNDDDDAVDEIVVDRNWSDEIKSSVSQTQSEQGPSPEKSGSHNHAGGVATTTDHDSVAIHAEGFWALAMPLIILRWRVWPAIVDFFSLKFFDEKSETHYRRENWFMRKCVRYTPMPALQCASAAFPPVTLAATDVRPCQSLALWSAVFLIVNWVLGVIFIPSPRVLADEIFYYGVAPALTFPILFMVIYDLPRDWPNVYQIVLTFSVWSWSLYQVLFIWLCGFFDMPFSKFTCGTKDFQGTFYYACALPTIALFGLKLKRFPAAIGAAVWFIITAVVVLPDRTSWVRNILNFLVFHCFLIYVHYMRETAERRLYTLRDQLKIQFRATQKAQVNERKAADSKRRLTSYVFHEVRVPLNTALLAVQNMHASGFAKAQDIEFKALEGSLGMMSKGLRNAATAWTAAASSRSRSRTRSTRSCARCSCPLRLAADARQLEFITDLDSCIDQVARHAALAAQGLTHEQIERALADAPDADGIVVGDETRLMQIITNLASNACKFTPPGGMLRVATRLIVPGEGGRCACGHHRDMDKDGGGKEKETGGGADEKVREVSACAGVEGEKIKEAKGGEGEVEVEVDEEGAIYPTLSANSLVRHNLQHSKLPECIVVRIEVTDTGYGIPPKEMVQSKLFSAFNQTEQGKQQGGKGTGLGLALVRQIVKRSGGRLGVSSKVGKGSTFWVELPLGVGAKAIATSPLAMEPPDLEVLFDPTTIGQAATATAKHESGVPSATHSAMHSLMEQGGLVELAAKPGENPAVITRTINDTLMHHPMPSPPEDAHEYEHEHKRTLSVESAPPIIEPAPARIRPAEPPRRPSTAAPGPLSPPITPATPATPPLPRASPTPSASSAPAFPPGLQVLVVDDDPLTRMLMSRLLTRLGCVVATAENGELALEMILGSGANANRGTGEEQQRYAVVFLDNQMPVMSGLTAVARLRELGRGDFVVGVTGNALLADQEEYLEAGVDQILTKPVLERSLKNMLAVAADRRKRSSTDAPVPVPSSAGP